MTHQFPFCHYKSFLHLEILTPCKWLVIHSRNIFANSNQQTSVKTLFRIQFSIAANFLSFKIYGTLEKFRASQEGVQKYDEVKNFVTGTVDDHEFVVGCHCLKFEIKSKTNVDDVLNKLSFSLLLLSDIVSLSFTHTTLLFCDNYF